MNAAARALHESNFFHGHLTEMRFSIMQFLQFVLLISVLLSALAIVYSTNQYRLNLSQFEHAKLEESNLQLEWGQLLLEQASISAPSHIQEDAVNVLKMSMPEAKNIQIVHLS
jgi:cell division protein FtsL